MLDVASGLGLVRDLAQDESTAELTRVLLNATSPAEAALALRILEQSAPEKALVAACNLREVIAELPATPCPIAVDAEVLEKVGGFERKPLGVLTKTLDDGATIDVLIAGNLVLDIVVRSDGSSAYWSPVPRDCEYATPGALDMMLASDELVAGLLDTARAMGLVFNPKLYLSLDDFRLEHAQAAIESIGNLF